MWVELICLHASFVQSNSVVVIAIYILILPRRQPLAGSCEPATLHHLLELLKVDDAVTVHVHLVDHLPAVLGGAALLEAEGGEHGAQLLHGDEPVAVAVEHVEGLAHVLLLVPLVHDGAVERAELLHVHATVAVGVDPLDHGRQLRLGDEDPQVLQRVGELRLGDAAVAVAVEHLEDPFQLRRVHRGCNGDPDAEKLK
ncbi:unnamed protein product [Musa acuminata var. zebrina]